VASPYLGLTSLAVTASPRRFSAIHHCRIRVNLDMVCRRKTPLLLRPYVRCSIFVSHELDVLELNLVRPTSLVSRGGAELSTAYLIERSLED
jgi:hypothetical protein